MMSRLRKLLDGSIRRVFAFGDAYTLRMTSRAATTTIRTVCKMVGHADALTVTN
jgi:hypothetical protein